MRLTIFVALIAVSILISLVNPFYGLLAFTWLAYMRPQNYVWAGDIRFSYFVSIAILLGVLLNSKKEELRFFSREAKLMIVFFIILSISTLFSYYPSESAIKLVEVGKILLIAVLTIGLTNTKERFHYLALVICLSFAFYSVKGAPRGLLQGVHLHGPEGSMIADNNDFALALNMVLPFFVYLGISEKLRWRKILFFFVFILTILAIIFTYSRGGFLGLCAVLICLVLKSRRKGLNIVVLIIATVLFLNFAPQDYKNRFVERVQSIKEYEQDNSAMGRIYAWQAAWRMAQDRPLTGVGFRMFVPMFNYYHWFQPRVAHNSYLQLLAENGFIALTIFLLLLILSFLKLRNIRKKIPWNQQSVWIHNYSHMLEAGFVGYIVSAMFLSRADFDLLYQFIGMTSALGILADKELENIKRKKEKEAGKKRFIIRKKRLGTIYA